MEEDERIGIVRHLLFEYVKSPSLRHIRDTHSLIQLSQEIVRKIDRGSSYWTKWNPQREALLKSAVGTWTPAEDLKDFLNGLPGPPLTVTDVTQRLRAFEEDEFFRFPDEDLRDGCLALYATEKAAGTELPAIIGALRDYIEQEERRLREERQLAYAKKLEEERAEREQRLISGADCNWTQIRGSTHWFCRANGRTYRLSPAKDKKWHMFRVNEVSDSEPGSLIGRYQNRGDATKVVKLVAYQAEPRW
ncbi:hypothetical protein GCM10008942_31800 [Rhizomicrobium electricum]|uniref:Uncharacterized protein n=2 Tax=Rhizomicrobium electricum TaxID=480070 RepID=A0ABP3Q583_9PROT